MNIHGSVLFDGVGFYMIGVSRKLELRFHVKERVAGPMAIQLCEVHYTYGFPSIWLCRQILQSR